jgi:2-oxoglutarate dehydrogenase complex dehydrogenase (E1) component-like enzyme
VAITADRDIPPKLPDTTNLVFTRSKNEYREIMAIAESVRAENKRPPFKKLTRVISNRRRCALPLNLRFPQKQNASPDERLQELRKKVSTLPHVIE